MILLELEMKDILFAQRVSRHFRSTINRSARLQRALFLDPEVFDGKSKPRFNPLLQKKISSIPIYVETCSDRDLYFVRHFPGKNRLALEASEPVFATTSGSYHRDNADPLVYLGFDEVFSSYPSDDAWYRSFAAPTASWRRMLLTQPPCPVWIEIHIESANDLYWDPVIGAYREGFGHSGMKQYIVKDSLTVDGLLDAMVIGPWEA